MTETLFCGDCGGRIAATAKFCGACGARQEPAADSSASSDPPTQATVPLVKSSRDWQPPEGEPSLDPPQPQPKPVSQGNTERPGGLSTSELRGFAPPTPRSHGAPAPLSAPASRRTPPDTPPPAGPYGGNVQRTPGKATASLVLGIIGLVFCPIVCSVLAIIFGAQAKAEIDSNPALGGRGQAQAGFICGIVGLSIGAILLIVILGAA